MIWRRDIPEPDEPCVLCGRVGSPLVRWIVWPQGKPCQVGWRCAGPCIRTDAPPAKEETWSTR